MTALSNPRHERFAQEVAAGRSVLGIFAESVRQGRTANEAFAAAGLAADYRFPQKGYYVYALIDPRSDKVFYVGKGQRRRHAMHASEARAGKVSNAKKFAIISAVHREGRKVQEVCLAHFDNEREALKVERTLIGICGFANLANVMPGFGTCNEKAYEEAKFMLRHTQSFCSWFETRRSSEYKPIWYWSIIAGLQEIIALHEERPFRRLIPTGEIKHA